MPRTGWMCSLKVCFCGHGSSRISAAKFFESQSGVCVVTPSNFDCRSGLNRCFWTRVEVIGCKIDAKSLLEHRTCSLKRVLVVVQDYCVWLRCLPLIPLGLQGWIYDDVR
jgi:hypothetical protein